MSLHFPYQLHRSKFAIASLGGRWVRPKPIIDIGIIGAFSTEMTDAFLDTGSDKCVFLDHLATALGIDLSQAPIGQHRGVGGLAYPLRYADVHLRISDGRTHLQWPATVGFTTAPMRYSLLGFAGFLQFFTATFEGDHERVTLTPNALLPIP